MSTGAVQFGIKNYKKLMKDVEQLRKAPETVIEKTISDVKKSAAGWVANEVTKVYGIKKKEIAPAKSKKGRENQKLAARFIGVKGVTIDELTLVYEGRLLTPVHFNMNPTEPNRGGEQTLKATILKGQRKTISRSEKLTDKQRKNIGRNFTKQGTRNSPKSPYMLQSTGNKKEGGVNYIPFQRRTQPGKMLYAFRTISVPQMITSERTRDAITKALNDGLQESLDKYLEKYM